MRKVAFYAVIAAGGAVIMALEILASRVLAPDFGNSVYVWGSIISVFLAALSAGYVWGGQLADRHPRLTVLGKVLLLAAAGIWVLGWAGRPMSGAIGRLTGHSPWGTLLAATLLFGVPSFLLATVSPFAIRLAGRDMDRLGNTAGRLFALSTAGSLAGTLGCTFLLIPNLELGDIFGLLLLATALTALITFLGESRENIPFALVAVGLALLGVVEIGRSRATGEHVLHLRMTPYQTLEVRELDGIRYLRSDGVLQSAIRVEDSEPALRYLRYSSGGLLLQPEVQRLLVLGMGGGAVGQFLERRLEGLEVDYVEIDPAVAAMAKDYFFFDETSDQRLHLNDARRYLNQTEDSWDYIYIDTYIGHSVPFHMTTVEFLDLVKKRLNAGGVLGANLAAQPDHPFVAAILRTMSERFASLQVFAVRGSSNLLVLASDSAQTLSGSELSARASELDRRWSFEPTLKAIAAARIDVDIDLTAAPVLTDRYAPADFLVSLRRGSFALPSLPED